MIKPTPYVLKCESCGYKKFFAPKSDALMPWEVPFNVCPKCGSDNIKQTVVNPLLESIISLFCLKNEH